MATWWRLESPRRLLETSRVSRESREIQTCFFETFWRSPAGLGDVSATSPSVAATSQRLILSRLGRRLHDVSETCWRPRRRCGDCRRRCGDVLATSGWFGCHLVWRRLSVVSETSRRCLGRRSGVALVRAQAIFWSPESPELPRLISRGSRDVSASEIGP